MKKLLTILTVAMLPSSAFALIGFGIQGGQDMSKLGAYSYSEGLVSINALEMDSNPAGIGVYAFVDLFGYALEAEADFAGGSYDFTFDNPISSIGPVNFVWGRASYSVTLKKNLMDVSIPFLAEAALNAGAGFGNHRSTPRASVSMVEELFGDDLTSVDALGEGMENKLVTYLEDNLIEAEALYRKSISKDSMNLAAKYNLGNSFYSNKLNEEALNQYRLSIKNSNDKSTLHKSYHNLGNLYMQSEDYQKIMIRIFKDKQGRN